jgi:hypothetical protein
MREPLHSYYKPLIREALERLSSEHDELYFSVDAIKSMMDGRRPCSSDVQHILSELEDEGEVSVVAIYQPSGRNREVYRTIFEDENEDDTPKES